MSDTAESEVRAVARAYYEAFRAGDLKRARSFVADRLLETTVIVGVNVNAEEDGHVRLPRTSALLSRNGKRVVRARRRGWRDPIRIERWTVDDVVLDEDEERARVDTAAERSYWMQKLHGEWKIVAFGSPTEDGLREFGGRWSRGPTLADD